MAKKKKKKKKKSPKFASPKYAYLFIQITMSLTDTVAITGTDCPSFSSHPPVIVLTCVCLNLLDPKYVNNPYQNVKWLTIENDFARVMWQIECFVLG